MKYFYTDSNKAKVGPLPVEALQSLHASGIITDATCVTAEGSENWFLYGDSDAKNACKAQAKMEVIASPPPLPNMPIVPPMVMSGELNITFRPKHYIHVFVELFIGYLVFFFLLAMVIGLELFVASSLNANSSTMWTISVIISVISGWLALPRITRECLTKSKNSKFIDTSRVTFETRDEAVKCVRNGKSQITIKKVAYKIFRIWMYIELAGALVFATTGYSMPTPVKLLVATIDRAFSTTAVQ